MPYIPDSADRSRFMSLCAFGFADPPSGPIAIPAIAEIANAFTANLMRLKSMMTFPALLAHFAGVLQRLTLFAEFELTGKVTRNEEFRDATTAKAIFDRFMELYFDHNAEIEVTRNDTVKVEMLV